MSPMMANCCRFWGLQSTLAPTSSMMVAVLAAVGKDHRQRRTIDAGNDAEDHLGGDHGGAGIAGGDKAAGRAVLDQAKPDAHRRVALVS